MRIVEALLRVMVIGCGLAAAPAMAFDGTKSDDAAAAPVTATQAFRTGAHLLKAGDSAKAVTSLEYAAEKGHALAQWKLGRMYAEGDGVTQNDLKAFSYFSRIADSHADDNPDTPQARFVANAFVALGHYYLDGIPKTPIKRDPERAREMFGYAASYFRDPEAQYFLARLYLDGVGAPHDLRSVARGRRRELLRARAERRRRPRDRVLVQRLPPHRPAPRTHLGRRRTQRRDHLLAQAGEPGRRVTRDP